MGIPSGNDNPVCISDAASTMMIPPNFVGQVGDFDSLRNGAFNSLHKRLANFPRCKPQAIKLGCEEANAMAEPIVSMSPFLPVTTGTAPLVVASAIQDARSSKIIPLVTASTCHMLPLVQLLAYPWFQQRTSFVQESFQGRIIIEIYLQLQSV